MNDDISSAAAADAECIRLANQGSLAEALDMAYLAIRLESPTYSRLFNAALLAVNTGSLDEGEACYRQAKQLGLSGEYYDRLFAIAHSSYLCTLSYLPEFKRGTLFAAHQRWYLTHGLKLKNNFTLTKQINKEDKIRIGFVSGDLYSHPVGILLSGIIAELDRNRFELYAYSNNTVNDNLTRYFSNQVAGWRDILNQPDSAVVNQIRQDHIDVLIDLSGHTRGNRLLIFCQRPAPIQMSFIGYWDTTGITDIDYVLMDPEIAPIGEDSYFVERLIRFEHCRFIYKGVHFAPLPVPAEKKKGPITFVCYNNILKINKQVATVWGEILRQVPESRLYLRWRTLGNEETQQGLRSLLTQAGVPLDRVMIGGEMTYDKILEEYNHVHIALDPFPFSGGMTSLDALFMEVPVITLQGDRPAGRQTQSFLKLLGLHQLVARNTTDYIHKAVRLAQDATWRHAITQGLRQRFLVSPLADVTGYVREFESIIETVYLEENQQ